MPMWSDSDAVLREREESLSKAQQTLDDQVTEKIELERGKIVVEEEKKPGRFSKRILIRRHEPLPTFKR
jgi:vacuolar-type H+-ATPase subunit H